MKYEKILLDLIEKVAVMEDRLELLELSIKGDSKNESNTVLISEDTEASESDISNRSFVTKHLTKTIQDSTNLSMRKAKRVEGGGVNYF